MSFRTNHMSALLTLVFLLASPCVGKPDQCKELQNVISACLCQAFFIDNVEDTTKVFINCRGRQLITMPKINGSSKHVIYEMTLAQNNLHFVGGQAFRGLRIQRLDLRLNRLFFIEPNAFSGLENDLTELYIGAEPGGLVRPPFSSLTNLTNLHTLALEYFKFDNNELLPGSLNILNTLIKLSLRYNSLWYIEKTAIPTSLISLELDNQSLSTLPLDLLRYHSQLQTLIITNTAIETITSKAFALNSKLSTLNMGYNKIRTLEVGCFQGITTNLMHLSLRNNPIRTASALDEIKVLEALQSLQLSEIGLSSLSAGAKFLRNKASLSEMYLEGNQLTTVDENVFAQAGNLTTLSLSSNHIGRMREQSLAGLTRLKRLYLSSQNAKNRLLLPKSLSQITTLTELAMTDTKIVESSLWQSLSGLKALQTLKAECTGLSAIPDYALKNLTKLRELYLDGNDISSLTQAMLAGPSDLAELDLSNNQIQTISNCAFYRYNFSRKLELYLFANPLNCDCRLKWLLEHTSAGKINLSGEETCIQPTDKDGRRLEDYRPEHLTCNPIRTPDTCEQLYTTSPTPRKPIRLPPSTRAPIPIKNLTHFG